MNNELAIGGTVFPHKVMHKTTWVSPDHITENQIDHVCINRKFRHTMLDIRTKRGADAASDHHLVITKLQLKLKRFIQMNAPSRAKYNVNQLREERIAQNFRVLVANKFQVLLDMDRDSENNLETCTQLWEKSRNWWNEACEIVLGKRRIQDKPWISKESFEKN